VPVFLLDQFGNAQVQDLQSSIPGDEEVLWLEMAMNNSLLRERQPTR
jgi:hypothetical protein